jgi:outer membrane protein assembly factor BamB
MRRSQVTAQQAKGPQAKRTRSHWPTRAATCGARGLISTATVAGDPVSGTLTVYVAGADGYLYALKAATGAVVWRSLVALPSATVSDYFNWSSPTVVNGHVYVGVSSQCDKPLVAGGLKEYDQATGALLNFYQTNPGGRTGPSIWSSASALASGRSVFVTTGNGPAGDSSAIVRLDGTTLAKQAIWQVPPGQQIPVSRRCLLATIFGSKLDARSRGTDSSTGPASVSTVLPRCPLREFPPLRPAGSFFP